MHPIHALTVLHELGLKLQAISGGRLYVEPSERITPGARQLIATHRDALFDLIQNRKPDADLGDLIVAFEERLAIVLEGGDVSDAIAHAIATVECGASICELRARLKSSGTAG